MATNPSINLNQRVKYLRNEVARLTNRNVELQNMVENLQQEKSELLVNEVMEGLIQSVQLANERLGQQESGEKQFKVSEMQATVRAAFAVQDDQLVIRVPSGELPLDPDLLGSITMTVSSMPLLQARNPTPIIVAALERAQVAYITWQYGPGSKISQEIVDQISHLIAIQNQWFESDFVTTMDALANKIVAFVSSLKRLLPSATLRAYRDSSQLLLGHTQKLAQLQRVSIEDAFYLAAILERVVEDHKMLVPRLPIMKRKRIGRTVANR